MLGITLTTLSQRGVSSIGCGDMPGISPQLGIRNPFIRKRSSRNEFHQVFLGKATVPGVIGESIGFVMGTILAMVPGPQLVGVSVRRLSYLCGVGIATATIMASYLPARRATRLDPCRCVAE